MNQPIDQIVFEPFPEEFDGIAIVCFIDLLGFTQEIQKKWGDANDNPLERIKEIYQSVNKHLRNKSGQTFLDIDYTTVVARAAYGKINYISDSFVIVIPIDNLSSEDFLASTISVVGSILTLWRTTIENGFTIRGGIDIGQVYWEDNNIIGPAYINAIQIEKKADISRIVLSSSICKKISTELFQPDGSKLKVYFENYFDTDLDGEIIINPILMLNFNQKNDFNKMVELLTKMQKNAPKQVRYKYKNLIYRFSNPMMPIADLNRFNQFKPTQLRPYYKRLIKKIVGWICHKLN